MTKLLGPLLLFWLAASPAAGEGWPTEGHDVRRTGQSSVVGPRSPTDVTSLALATEQAINVPVTVAAGGTLFTGTWGVIRSLGEVDRTLWDKSDGKVFAFRPDLEPAWPAPFPGDRVPYCYHYPGRPGTPGQCPQGGTVSYYNGTVEGTAALSADGSVLYVGRGDGKLYAVEAASGALRWVFRTFNPLDPGDPDGGGEVIAAPLVAPDGTIYLATAAAGPHETNAIYAVSPTGGLLWRYPQAEASYPNLFVAAPALSPDGRTLYVAGAWGPAVDDWDESIPGTILAFALGGVGPGPAPLKWIHSPINTGEPGHPTVWTTALAVGTDGTLFATGSELYATGRTAVAFALRDRGTHAEPAWPAMVDLDRGRTTFSIGLALREVGGSTTRVYAGSGSVFVPLVGYLPGGKLYALDPATGAALWPEPFDPEAHGGIGSLTGLAIDREGVIYTGVSGRLAGGWVYALGEAGGLLWQLPIPGLLEWAHPVLGPEGNLYFGETRRAVCAIFPIESGACSGVDIDPRLYVVRPEAGAGGCVADERTLCLNGGRFQVTVEYRTAQGVSGDGRVAPVGSADSGLFWFFDPANWEMLVKVLDGCPVNGHVWVFAAATTDVELTLRVLDTRTALVREYPNALGQTAPTITDTSAFATCDE
ncbi:MAG TPA: PQQ-binding-like beta-propeller repeat protein [Thermoanaerobaculia bacterium]|nr:PQQ-binding-like beta-propeller repeat protein [Thermoanaerobaculia bacterium]